MQGRTRFYIKQGYLDTHMNSEAAEAGRGKSGLIKAVMDRMAKNNTPISRRKAEKAVNAVFKKWTRALWRGENVELPVGWITAVPTPPKRRGRRVQKFRDPHIGGFVYRLVLARDRMICFRSKRELIEKAPFAPPPLRPLSPEVERKAEEVLQLYQEITGTEMDFLAIDFKTLMQAADNNLDWLLARLQEIKKRRAKTINSLELAATVRQLHWIRPRPEKDSHGSTKARKKRSPPGKQ
jgi:nucleoid DNA-binding protein